MWVWVVLYRYGGNYSTVFSEECWDKQWEAEADILARVRQVPPQVPGLPAGAEIIEVSVSMHTCLKDEKGGTNHD